MSPVPLCSTSPNKPFHSLLGSGDVDGLLSGNTNSGFVSRLRVTNDGYREAG